MVKIDIISGFLGAGKTTLIKKLLKEALAGEKVVLLENEFGDVGIDGGFMKEAGINVTEMNSGCICCSLVGDFSKSLQKIIADFNPERILIEPSGVGKLSEVVKAVQDIDGLTVNCCTAVADASKCKMYSKNFGEFYNNQLESATAIVLSRTGDIQPEKLDKAMEIIREKNPAAPVVTTDWNVLDGKDILAVMEGAPRELLDSNVCPVCGHEHAHEHCDHEHHHEHGCCDHEHHHDHVHCDHEHHHEHGHCHHAHEHGHHHADDVFMSIGIETARALDKEKIQAQLEALEDNSCGTILRAKGILQHIDGSWFEFDYVPGEVTLRSGNPDYTGRIVFIGTDLNEKDIRERFGL